MRQRRRLSLKQQLFVTYYLGTDDGNATAAARRAEYAFPDVAGAKLLKCSAVADAIAAEMADHSAGAAEVLIRLTDHARATMADFLSFQPVKDEEGNPKLDADGHPVEEWRLDLAKARRRGKLHQVKRIVPTRYGVGIELYSAAEALVRLGQKHALFTERFQFQDGIDPADLTDEQLESYIAKTRKAAGLPPHPRPPHNGTTYGLPSNGH